MRCDLCFKDKSGLQPILPKCNAKVCKGCFYEIDRVIGFLEHYGVTFITQGSFPETKPKRTRSTRKPLKVESNTKPLESP